MNKNILLLLVLMVAVAIAWSKPASGKSAANTFKDLRDGQVYKTVKIGKQTWMAQNLNYGKAMRGKAELKAGQKYCYNDNVEKCKRYGGLYTWDVAMQSCPKGWHLPSAEEWNEFEKNVRDVCENFEALEGKCKASSIGAALKDSRFCNLQDVRADEDWERQFICEVITNLAPNSGIEDGKLWEGTDDVGFTALPAGWGERRVGLDSTYGEFHEFGQHGDWWSSTEVGEYGAWRRGLSAKHGEFNTYDIDKGNYLSVRCLKD